MYADEKIRKAIKTFLNEEKADRLNVSKICKNVNINRQTFYYYFKDVHDALKGTYWSDYKRYMEVECGIAKWDQLLQVTLEYLKENKRIINHIYFSNEREQFKKDLEQLTMEVIEPLLHEVMDSSKIQLKEETVTYICRVYGAVILNIIYWYIEEGMEEPAEIVVKRAKAVLNDTLGRTVIEMAKIDAEDNEKL